MSVGPAHSVSHPYMYLPVKSSPAHAKYCTSVCYRTLISFNDQVIPLYISHYGMFPVQPCQSNHVTKRRGTALSNFGNHFGSHFHLNMHMCVQSLSAGKDGVTCVCMLLHVEARAES